MRLSKYIAALAAIFAVTSCASLNGGSNADLDHDGVISGQELRVHQNRINAGSSEMDYEAQRFEHIDNMIGIGKRILDGVSHF